MQPSSTPDRVLVGFTGGLRSSIAVMMLKTQGAEVIGAFLDFNGTPWDTHCSKDSKETALTQAAAYDLPLQIIPVAAAFKALVADQYLHDVLNRRVPQTCLNCHRQIIFPLLAQLADEHRAGRIATGHRGTLNEGQLERTGLATDQSDWLAFLPREVLRRITLPLGTMTQAQVTKLAAELQVIAPHAPPAETEQRRICRLSQQDWLTWATPRVPTGFQSPGPITHQRSVALAEHHGILDYPLGTTVVMESADEFIVRDFDLSNKSLQVERPEETGQSEILVEGINWIDPSAGNTAPFIEVEVHASGLNSDTCRPTPGLLFLHLEREGRVAFRQPMTHLFRGTPVVFCVGKRILGSGWVT